MHHVPEGPAPRVRPTSGASRRARLLGRASGHRSGRLALSTFLSSVVTALVLAVPVVAGNGVPHSPVVLGQDGVPTSETFAGLTSSATFSTATGETTAAPEATWSSAAPVTSAAPPAGDVAGAPAVPEVVAPTPAPSEDPPAPAPAPETVPVPEVAASAPEVTVPAPAAAPATPSGGTEDQVVALVNEERAAAGCGPVSADGGLASVARAHSDDMRDRAFFDHVNPEGLSPFDRADDAGVDARAENIARGQVDAADVMNSWMNSAGHRANILDCGLTRLGVGIAEGGGGPWWTQLFG